MEHPKESRNRTASGKLTTDVAKTSTPAGLNWPHITDLIDVGQITIGVLQPAGCVAIASDGHDALAMLVRHPGETLVELLIRLDLAIDKALTQGVRTDEINKLHVRRERR